MKTIQRISIFSTLLILGALFNPHAATPLYTATKISDLNPGTAGSYPSNITVFAKNVFFSAYTLSTGVELWRYNGTNISLVKDINETADDIGGGIMEGNDSIPSWLTPWGNFLYFSAYDARRGGELWRTDGTTTTRVADISPDANDTIKLFAPYSSWPSELTLFNNSLYSWRMAAP
jgi:ELWxxDGT repeat protein